MSSLSYRGVLFETAAKTLPIQPENEEHAHNAIHAPVQHTHINVDVPDDLRVMNLQVSAVEGDYDDTLPGGLVADVIYVSEALNVVDQAFIRVDPDTNILDTSVIIGYDPNTMKEKDTGVYIHRDRDVITLNSEVGIRAPGHTIEGANFVSEWNVSAQRDIEAGSIMKTPLLETSHIKLYGNQTKLVVQAPIVIEKGGLNASNLDINTLSGEILSLTRGDIVCRNLYATGTVKGLHLFEHLPQPLSHTGQGQLNGQSVRVGDKSLYIGLMRRSYDRATHKPVTHILKRQIPTYLAAQGFVLADIPSPFTVDNMTIHDWIVLAQGFKSDTTMEVDTVFPVANTADWEDYISPVSIDLDAAEVEIDALDTRITALETISGVVVFDNISDNDDLPIASTDRIVLVRHSEKTGIVCTLPSSGMLHGQIIVIKNLQIGDGSEQSGNSFLITVRPAQNQTPIAHTIDGKFTSLTLNATSDASGALTGTPNEACRLMWESINKTWIALNDAY